VGHEDKNYRTLDLMKERTSNAYRMQDELMTGHIAPQFGNAHQFQAVPQFQQPPQYNQAPQYHQQNMDPQGNKGGFRGRRGGGIGRGRGPIIAHNSQKQEHYARNCPQPAATCMYCHATDHVTEESQS